MVTGSRPATTPQSPARQPETCTKGEHEPQPTSNPTYPHLAAVPQQTAAGTGDGRDVAQTVPCSAPSTYCKPNYVPTWLLCHHHLQLHNCLMTPKNGCPESLTTKGSGWILLVAERACLHMVAQSGPLQSSASSCVHLKEERRKEK